MFINQQGVSTVSTDLRSQELPHPRQRFGRLGPGRAWGLIGLAGGETSRWGRWVGTCGWEDETFRFRFHGVFDDLDGFSH